MATECLLSGPNALVKDRVYALPGRAKFLFCTDVLTYSARPLGPFTGFLSQATNIQTGGGIFVTCTTSTTAVCILSNS